MTFFSDFMTETGRREESGYTRYIRKPFLIQSKECGIMRQYMSRILHDKRKLFFAMVLIALPILDVVQIVSETNRGFEMPKPEFATFLSLYTSGTNHLLHKLMFWFLPLYLLMICVEDSIEDTDIHYKAMLICRMGRKKYYCSKMRNTFFCAAGIVFVSLLLNYILVKLLFSQGTFIKFVTPSAYDAALYILNYGHPVAANIVYIFLTGFLAGLIACVGTALALSVHNRKAVYGITFFLWFVPVMMKNSLMLVIQPFMEYDFHVVIPTLLLVVIGYVMIIVVAYVVERKYEEISV